MTFTSKEYDRLALQAINESKDLGIGQSEANTAATRGVALATLALAAATLEAAR